MNGLRRAVVLLALGLTACGLASDSVPTTCNFTVSGAVTGTATGVNCVTYTHSSAANLSSFFTIAIVAEGTQGEVEAGLELQGPPTAGTTYIPSSLANTDGGSALEFVQTGATGVYAFLDGTSLGPPGGQGTFSMNVTSVDTSAAGVATSTQGVTFENVHGTITGTLPAVITDGGGGIVTLTGSF